MKKIFVFCSIFLLCNCCFASDELSKQAVAFYSDNNFDKTLDMLLQIEEKDRTAQDWLLLGNLYDEKGQKENAIFMYQKAIFVDKKYYKPYYNLANIFLADEKYTIAIEHYKDALKYNKTNPYIFYNLGCAYLKQGNIKKARSAFQEAVTLKSDVPEFHYNLAYVYRDLNKPDLAKTYLENYNKLCPIEN